VPQLPQNRAPGSSGLAQVGQVCASGLPHSMQKRSPSRFSLPHAPHCTGAPLPPPVPEPWSWSVRRIFAARVSNVAPGRSSTGDDPDIHLWTTRTAGAADLRTVDP
jgi:hypothetical protein